MQAIPSRSFGKDDLPAGEEHLAKIYPGSAMFCMEVVVDDVPQGAGIPLHEACRIVEAVHSIHAQHWEVLHVPLDFPQLDVGVVLLVWIECVRWKGFLPLNIGPFLPSLGGFAPSTAPWWGVGPRGGSSRESSGSSDSLGMRVPHLGAVGSVGAVGCATLGTRAKSFGSLGCEASSSRSGINR